MHSYSGNRQLLFKAWRESSARFFLSAGTIAALCTVVVLFNTQMRRNPGRVPHGFKALTYNEHVYHFIYSGTAKGLFAVLVLFIGLGGLLRERSRGTAPFTLALPASRTRLILSQIMVGSAQVIAIAVLPLILIPTLSPLVHESYPVSASLHFALLWMAGGLMIFGASFLCSVMLPGDYTALIVAFLTLFGVPLLARLPGIEELQVNFLMTMGEFGTMHWNPEHTLLLPSPMPWVRLLVFCFLSAAFLWSALIATKRQEF